MPVNDGEFSKSIRCIGDLQKFFGYPRGTGIGYIIRNAPINKWSKRKPVRFSKLSALTEEEFKGNTTDRVNGIIYGLKGRASATSYAELHDITYEYVGRPMLGGSVEPFRFLDFDGYDHYAKCNLNGVTEEDGSTIYYDLQDPLSIYIDFDYLGNNTTGVDLSDFTDNNDDLSIEDYYPCVMVDNYAKALVNSQLTESSMTDKYTPILYEGAYYTRFKTSINLADLRVDTNRKVSFFLIKKINDNLIDLTNWVNVSDKIFLNPLIAIPGSTGLNYVFEAYYKTYYAIATLCRATTNGFTINLEWENGEAPEVTTEVTFMLNGGDVLGSKTITYYPPSEGIIPMFSVSFTWSEVGLLPIPGNSVNVAGHITPGGRAFDFTITAL